MAIKTLKLTSKTNMFGTNVTLGTGRGAVTFDVGTNLEFDPLPKLSKTLDRGYLFRSPNVKPQQLSEIWPTLQDCSGEVAFSATLDDKTKDVTALVRIEDKYDATNFAFTHSIFEKWSDEKQAEAEAKALEKERELEVLKVNDDGTVRIKVEVTTLGD